MSREALLRVAYPGIRVLAAEARSTKLLVSVVDTVTAEPVAHALIDARPGIPTPLVVGRHSCAHLRLPTTEDVSLRQLLVMVHPMRTLELDAMTFSVRDLRSTEGRFADEEGRKHEAVIARGALLLFVNRYALLLLPIDERTTFPERPEDAPWLLPPPSLVSEIIEAPKRRPPATRATSERRETQITVVPSPVSLANHLLSGESRSAELRISSYEGRTSYALGPTALKRGVLIGNYRRCDTSRMDSSVSRVHALALELDGVPYLIDTGSSFGTFRAGEEAPLAIDAMAKGARYRLGEETLLEWC